MFYEAKVGDAAPVGKKVATASEVGADQEKLDELRDFIKVRKTKIASNLEEKQNYPRITLKPNM